MTSLIQRPEYIKYHNVAWALDIESTMSDFEQMEGEKTLFQWALPHCFMNPKSPWLFYPSFKFFLATLFFSFFISVQSNCWIQIAGHHAFLLMGKKCDCIYRDHQYSTSKQKKVTK